VSFEEVWGQEQAVGFLWRALAAGRLAHALAFVGPAGVGRRLTARELAQALLCEHPDREQGGCGVCASCRRLASGNHPNYFELARQTGKQVVEIDLLREFLKPMGHRLARGERRIFAIDDAESFKNESYNLVLKRLEEPPPGNFVILITQSLDALPDTVVSRSQVVRFHRLGTAVLERVLVERCGLAKKEAEEVAPLLVGTVAPLADGVDTWLAERRWVIDAVCSMEPGDEVAVAEELLSRATEATDSGVERNLKAAALLRPVIWLYRDALVWRHSGEEELLSGAVPVATVEKVAEKAGAEGLEKSLANLLRASVELQVSNPAIRLSELFVELVRRPHERATPVAGR